jgi:hypothetical protein
MLTAILSFLGGPVIGSVIGAATAYFNRRLDIELKKHEMEQRRLDREHEIALRRADIDLAREEAKGKAEVAIIEGNFTAETERQRTLAAMHTADAQGPNDWVDKFRRSVRPVLSYALTAGAITLNAILAWLFWSVWDTLDRDTQNRVLLVGVEWIFTQASIVISYWFASRPSELPKVR